MVFIINSLILKNKATYMKRSILLIVVVFCFTVLNVAGSNVEKLINNKNSKELEVASLQQNPPFYFPKWVIAQRINRLNQEIQDLIYTIIHTPPEKIKLKKIKIINARGYDGVWDGWTDVQLRMKGNKITETVPNNNNPVFDLDVEVNADVVAIEVMDEDVASFELMGTIYLNTNYPNDSYVLVKEYEKSGAEGNKERGFEWTVTVEVTY